MDVRSHQMGEYLNGSLQRLLHDINITGKTSVSKAINGDVIERKFRNGIHSFCAHELRSVAFPVPKFRLPFNGADSNLRTLK